MQLEAQLVHAEPGKRVVQVRALAKDQCLCSALGEAPTAEEAEDRASTRLLARLATQPEPSPRPPTKSQSQAPSPQPDHVHRPAVIPTAIPSQAPGPEPTTEPVPAPAAAPNDSEPKLPPFQKLEPPSGEPGGEP